MIRNDKQNRPLDFYPLRPLRLCARINASISLSSLLQNLAASEFFRNFVARIAIKPYMIMTAQDIFKRYDSPEQYAEAFQQMIDARERWREQVREQEAKSVQ